MAFTFDGPHELAPTGSTGNATHDPLHIGSDYMALGMLFIVEAVGATPTVTWKVQGSISGDGAQAAEWFDIAYITDATDTLAVTTRTATAVGHQINFLANPSARKYKFIRLVTSANTNVTYRAEAYLID